MIYIPAIAEDFEPQAPKSNYVKLTPGIHHLRILSPSISGYVYWEDTPEGGRKPIRSQVSEGISMENGSEARKFLAFSVWNYDQSRIQVWEITQVSLQRELTALDRNKKWGDLQDYDLEVERTGVDKNNTKYSLRPEPKTDLDEEIMATVTDKGLPQLEALFQGADPFNWNGEATETLDPKEIEKLPF